MPIVCGIPEARTGEHRERRFRGEPVGWGACAEPGGALVNTGGCRAGAAHILFGTRVRRGEGCGFCRAEGLWRRARRGNAAWGAERIVTAPPCHPTFPGSHFHFSSGPEEKEFSALAHSH